jgi:nicotinamide mononucleotide transporter
MDAVLAGARAMSPWETAAVLLAIGYLLLAVRENIWCWYCAFASTAIYTVLFWDVNLLMESALNVYYMGMAVFGWYQWTYGHATGDGAPHDSTGAAITIQSLSRNQHLVIIVVIGNLSLVSGYLLSQYSMAAWPYVDSFTTWASVITTYLVAKKFLENWLYWIVIDSVSIPLYLDRGLPLTAWLFASYVVIAIAGYFSWKKHLEKRLVSDTRCRDGV